MESGDGDVMSLILTRLNAWIDSIMTRPTKSNTIVRIVSKIGVSRPRIGVMAYSLRALEPFKTALTLVVITFENRISILIISVVVSIIRVNIFIHRVTFTPSNYAEMSSVGSIRASLRTISSVFQHMIWSIESTVTELACLGVLVHQYNNNKGKL